MNNHTNGVLEEKTRALVETLDRITASPEFISVFTIAVVHNMPYTGEQWSAELDAVRSLLGMEKPNT